MSSFAPIMSLIAIVFLMQDTDQDHILYAVVMSLWCHLFWNSYSVFHDTDMFVEYRPVVL